VTFHNQVDASGVREMMAAARDAGINFSTTPRSMPMAKASG
jgi:hypothetical protein